MLSFLGVSNDNNSINCGICLDPIETHAIGHEGENGEVGCLIHEKCAKQWAVQRDTCALCKMKIDPKSILSSDEIQSGNESMEAEEIAAKKEQEENDEIEAQRIQFALQEEDQILHGNEMEDDVVIAHALNQQLNGDQDQVQNDAIFARALQGQENGRGSNRCLTGAIIVVAALVAFVAKDYFIHI